jgi:hypothetical protein
MDRSAQCRSRQHQQHIRRRAERTESVEFFNLLTGGELLELTESLLPEHRERLYPPTVALSMFLKQVLDEDDSCQKAVNGWATQRLTEGLKANSVRTAGYCKARHRLPLEMVQTLTRTSAKRISTQAPANWGWRGRAVKLVDGTTVGMPDTQANQRSYPQSSTQARGLGFPIARVIGVMCLSTGAIVDAAMGGYSGKEASELALFRALNAAFEAADVMLADSYYCNYFLIAALQMNAVDAVFQQHGSRTTDFRRGQALGTRDHIVQWRKPARPEWMTKAQYASFPATLTVREVRVDHRILVTTMLDHRKLSKGELGDLYARRWQVELDLRNLKSTLGMGQLKCRTPQMNEKQLWVTLLAYNLICLLMAQAAARAGVPARQLSFKHTLQIWVHWLALAPVYAVARDSDRLFALIGQIRVGNRPGRIEPRARKLRHNDYPRLMVPRADAREHLRLHGHPDLR